MNPAFKRRPALFAVFFFLAAGLALYGNTFQHRFAGDDYLVIVDNAFIKSWANLAHLFDASYLTTGKEMLQLGQAPIGSGESTYRPLVTFSYFLLYHFFGLQASGWHVVSVGLHIANTLLLYAFLYLVTRKQGASFFGASLFLLHPVNSEAVNCISYNEDLLVFFFGLSSFVLWILSGRPGNAQRTCYAASLICFVLALAAKEMAAVLPILFLLHDYFFVSALDWKRAVKTAWKRWLPFAALTGVYVVFYLQMYSLNNEKLGEHPALRTLTPENAPLLIYNVGRYLRWLIQPEAVYPIYPFFLEYLQNRWLDPGVLASAAGTLLLLAGAWYFRRTQPFFSFSIFWFYLAMIPVYPMSVGFFASRFLYIPGIGFFLLVGILLDRWRERIGFFAAGGFFAVLAGVYFYAASLGNWVWLDNITLRSAIARSFPSNSVIRTDLGTAYLNEGYPDKAIAQYKTALKLDPENATASAHLGLAFHRKQRFREAEHFFGRAVRLRPDYAFAWMNLGLVSAGRSDFKKAEYYLEKANRIAPQYDAYYALGVIYSLRGDTEKAEKFWKAALALNPKPQAQKSLSELQRASLRSVS